MDLGRGLMVLVALSCGLTELCSCFPREHEQAPASTYPSKLSDQPLSETSQAVDEEGPFLLERGIVLDTITSSASSIDAIEIVIDGDTILLTPRLLESGRGVTERCRSSFDDKYLDICMRSGVLTDDPTTITLWRTRVTKAELPRTPVLRHRFSTVIFDPRTNISLDEAIEVAEILVRDGGMFLLQYHQQASSTLPVSNDPELLLESLAHLIGWGPAVREYCASTKMCPGGRELSPFEVRVRAADDEREAGLVARQVDCWFSGVEGSYRGFLKRTRPTPSPSQAHSLGPLETIWTDSDHLGVHNCATRAISMSLADPKSTEMDYAWTGEVRITLTPR